MVLTHPHTLMHIKPARPSSSRILAPTRVVLSAIQRLWNGRAHDHEGLVVEHISHHATQTLASLLVRMFNRAFCEGFPSTWSSNTITPILKDGVLWNLLTSAPSWLVTHWPSYLDSSWRRGKHTWMLSMRTSRFKESLFYIASHLYTQGHHWGGKGIEEEDTLLLCGLP